MKKQTEARVQVIIVICTADINRLYTIEPLLQLWNLLYLWILIVKKNLEPINFKFCFAKFVYTHTQFIKANVWW